MIVYRKKANVTKIAGIFIYPAYNKLDEKQTKALKESDEFARQVELGYINIEDDGEAVSIDSMKVSDAKRIVEKTYSLKELDNMKKETSKKTVLSAINKQIKAIKEEREKKEEEQGEEK